MLLVDSKRAKKRSMRELQALESLEDCTGTGTADVVAMAGGSGERQELLPFNAFRGIDTGGAGQKLSAIDRTLDDLFERIDSGDGDGAKALVGVLRSELKVTNGQTKRARGGWQYTSMCILDSVLLADNLKPLSTDTDLLPEVVFQQGPKLID